MPPAPALSLLGALSLAATAAAFRPYASLSRAPLRPLPAASTPRRAPASTPAAAAPGAAPWCAPGQACWPTAAQWAELNASVAGRLVAVQPPLAPCFPGPAYDPAQCQLNIANYSDSYWRASQPGAMQSPNLEQDPVTGADCFDGAKPCELGNIPPFAVTARSAADVAATLAFARAHNLRVAVKSTGHEYQGRSTSANALLIWLHEMRGVSTSASFAACEGDEPQPALTAAPGDSWATAYAAADAAGATVVGGSEVSVSACGGYTFGGGHSWTSAAYGLAVDNLLQATAVLANGTVVTASRCENPDLFWALRGGGGGTFAVATQCIYALHPTPPGGVAGATMIVKLLRGEGSFAAIMDTVLYCVGNIWGSAENEVNSGVVGGGYFVFNLGESTVELLAAFNGSTAQANLAVTPLVDFVQQNPLDYTIAASSLTQFASYHAWHSSWDPTSEATGAVSTIGSRLVPTSLLKNDAQRNSLAINLTTIAAYLGGLEGLLTCGGVVQQLDRDSAATSVVPAWRDAGIHLAIGSGWALNASLAQQQATLTGISELTNIMRAAVPDSGAYWSESDFLAPAWQQELFGATYPRLQAVKKAVDPTGVFTCRECRERTWLRRARESASHDVLAHAPSPSHSAAPSPSHSTSPTDHCVELPATDPSSAPGDPPPGAALVLAACAAGAAAQQFVVNNAGLGVIIPAADAGSVCLSAAAGAGAPLTFEICAGGDAAELGWSLKSGAAPAPVAWNATGLCWAAMSSPAAPGVALGLAACGAGSPAFSHDAATSLVALAGSSPPLCAAVAGEPQPLLAQYIFASHMVLQQDAPVEVFGFHAAPGAAVDVALGPARGSATANASGAWSVTLPAMPRGGPYNLSASSAGATQICEDVWLGIVLFCSGQSNLSGGNTPVSYVWNSSAIIAEAANFSQVRIFSEGTSSQGAAAPLDELEFAPLVPWSVASPASVPPFSGVCWLAGRRIAEVLGPVQPVGLIEAAWGGTSQQVWMPPEALDACAPTPAGYPGGWPLAPACLFNSMVSPIVRFRLAGVVWYQGESERTGLASYPHIPGPLTPAPLPLSPHAGNALSPFPSYGPWYACALPQLIASWRARFRSPRAWWGTVQLSTWSSSAADLNEQVAAARDVEARAAQEAGLAHVTTATAVDGGDESGSIHTRCKLDLGRRLGDGFLFDAGALPSSASSEGPRFAGSVAGGGAPGAGMSATVRFAPPFDAAGSLNLVAPGADDGQLCTSPSFVSTSCPPGVDAALCRGFELQDGATGTWWPAAASLSADGSALVLTAAAGAPQGAAANATSAGWSLWPISLLYGKSGNVAAFPWRRAI